MMQAGLQPFPTQTGAHMIQPGPMTHDGLLFAPQQAEEGDRTMASINAMITDLGQWDSGLPLEDELRRTWHENMCWWGPAGIGATCSIERYANNIPDRFAPLLVIGHKRNINAAWQKAITADFLGWPNFTATLSGHFMGMPATGLSERV